MTSARALFDLGGKVALITGASRGLGLAMAEGLGEMGARVVLAARGREGLEGAANRLAERGIEARTVVADLADPAAVAPLADAALAAFGRLDILINNAGFAWVAPAQDYPDDAWRRTLSLTVDAPFMLSREVARRAFIPQHSGKIINVSSIAGLRGNTTRLPDGGHIAAYHTGKGALVNLSRALAVEWGCYGINVNCLCPGYFPTRLSEKLLQRIGDDLVAATPLRRLGEADDIKGVAAFLASEAARHITGQVIVVDGGFTAA